MEPRSFRYRGAQPFADDAVSRRTFFGREAAAHALTDQILANRLVVVYARSGVGKSSLLNAGVAQLLRDAGCQPLMLRVNDLRGGASAAIRDAVAAEARRQGVEYVAGAPGSLWEFFKTVEFWAGDTLLTPVLVLDQFEELFTLQDEPAREALLAELGPLVRGVPPPELAHLAGLDSPPPLHLVLSLREEFLGMLDDAADRIPQIMDHRFRLTPLGRADAAAAMRGPAEVVDPLLGTQCFSMAPAFVDAVLDHLGAQSGQRRQIEPFHLQLICQRVEEIVAADPALGAPGRQFGLDDFGGAPALTATMTAFYTRVVAGIAGRAQRAAARRLCEDYLISPEGRRLSLEASQTREQVGLTEAALGQLMADRLLRADRRSDALYVELGHDALIEPILATRRARALVTGWAAMAAGMVCGSLAAMLAIFGFMALVMDQGEDLGQAEVVTMVVFLLLAAGSMVLLAGKLLLLGQRTQRRFGRRPPGRPGTTTGSDIAMSPGRRQVGHLLRTLGLGLRGVALLGVAGNLFMLAVVYRYGDALPAWASWLATTPMDQDGLRMLVVRPGTELPWIALEMLAVWLAGGALRRWAEMVDLPSPHTPLPPALARWRDALVLVAVLALVLAIGLGWHCQGAGQGSLPTWWPLVLTPFSLWRGCHALGPLAGGDAGGLFSLVMTVLSLALAVSPHVAVWLAHRLRVHRASAR